MDPLKARRFAEALTELCHQHGVMLWTPLETQPIIASDVGPDDDLTYRYEARRTVGRGVVIRRILE